MANEAVKSEFTVLLDRALADGIGLAIKTPNRGALRRLLYESKAGKSEYDNLVITLSPISQDELWIVKKEHYGRVRGGKVSAAAEDIEADNNNDPG